MSLVQAATPIVNGSGATQTLNLTGVANNALLVLFTSWSGETLGDFASVTDGVNDAKWTVDKKQAYTGHGLSWGMAYAVAVTGGDLTVVVHYNNTPAAEYVILEEHSPVSAFDKSAIQYQDSPGTGTDAITSGASTASSGDYAVAASFDASFDHVIAHGTGFTDGTASDDPGNAYHKTEWLASGAANQAGTFTAAAAGGTDLYTTGVMCFTIFGPPPNGGYYLQEDGTFKFTLEDGSGFYLIESWSTSAVANFPPFIYGDLNGIGTPGRFFKERLS
jgi:hypothetical protein